MELIPHWLTPMLWDDGIWSLTGVANLVGPLVQLELYLHRRTHKASPKAISGRTSYYWVWLAFHSDPQVIPQVFSLGGFRPSRTFTYASPCPWIDHPVSGLLHATIRPIQTRFRYDYASEKLNLATQSKSPAHYAKGTRSCIPSKAWSSTSTACRPLRFQVLFHFPPGELFTFPSQYFFTIGC